MLTELEKERLLTRGKLNPHTRNTNDLRARKKLKTWLDDIKDIELILASLPINQLNKTINKNSPIYLASLAARIKHINYRFIVGPLEFPDTWRVVDYNDMSTSAVEDIDIITSLITMHLIELLATTCGATANLTDLKNLQNPITKAIHLTEIPNVKDRLTPGEKLGIEKINQALKKSGYEELEFKQLKPPIA